MRVWFRTISGAIRRVALLVVLAGLLMLGFPGHPGAAQDDPDPLRVYNDTSGGTLTLVVRPGWQLAAISNDPAFLLSNPTDTYQMEILPDPLPYFRRAFGQNPTIQDIIARNDDTFAANPDVQTGLDYETDLTTNDAVISQRLVQVTEEFFTPDGRRITTSYFTGVGFLSTTSPELYFFTVLGPEQDDFAQFQAAHTRALEMLSTTHFEPEAPLVFDTDLGELNPDTVLDTTLLERDYSSDSRQRLALVYPAGWTVEQVGATGRTVAVQATTSTAPFVVEFSYVADSILQGNGYDTTREIGDLLNDLRPFLVQNAYFGPRFEVYQERPLQRFELAGEPYAEFLVFYSNDDVPHMDAFGLRRIANGVVLSISTFRGSTALRDLETYQRVVRGMLTLLEVFPR